MGNKMGAIFGLLIVVIFIGYAIIGYNNMSESSEETIEHQSTEGSIQETLMEED